VSSCGSPCVGNYFIGKHAKYYTEELIKVDFKSKCIIESDSNEKKIYAKKIFSNTRKTLINLNEKNLIFFHQNLIIIVILMRCRILINLVI
jgi:hypothetical protein